MFFCDPTENIALSLGMVYTQGMENSPLLTVYYDQLCVLCSKEIDHYRKQKGSENIRFVDITSSNFDAALEGVDPFLVHKIMHARRADGSLATRVEAFVAIWEVLPKYRWAAKLARKKPIHAFLDLGYSVFAFARPYLPRRSKDDCSASPYCEIHQNHNTLKKGP